MWKTLKLFFGLTVALLSACGLMRLGEMERLYVEIGSPRPSQEIGVRDGEALVLPLEVKSNGRVVLRVLDEAGGEIRTLDPPDNGEAMITDPATLRRLLRDGYVDLFVVARAYRGEDSFAVPGFFTRTSPPVEVKETEPIRVRFIKAFAGRSPKLDLTVNPKVYGVGWLGFGEGVTPTLMVSVGSPSRKLLLEYQGVDDEGGVSLPTRQRELTVTPGETQVISLTLVPLRPGQRVHLQGALVDGGGNETRFGWKLQVSKLGLDGEWTFRWLEPMSATIGFRGRWMGQLPGTQELKSREAWARVPTEDHYDIGGMAIFAFLTLLCTALPFLRR